MERAKQQELIGTNCFGGEFGKIVLLKGGRSEGGHLVDPGPLTPRSALDLSSAGYCDRAPFSTIQ